MSWVGPTGTHQLRYTHFQTRDQPRERATNSVTIDQPGNRGPTETSSQVSRSGVNFTHPRKFHRFILDHWWLHRLQTRSRCRKPIAV